MRETQGERQENSPSMSHSRDPVAGLEPAVVASLDNYAGKVAPHKATGLHRVIIEDGVRFGGVPMKKSVS